MNENWWKLGLAAGLGIAAGILGTAVVSRGKGGDLRKVCTSLLSHGMDVKEKAATLLETAKENIEDLAAEARHESELRKQPEEKTDATEKENP